VDADLRQTAVHDALLSYVQHPQKYDPQRGALAAYLRMSAHGRLCNLLRKEAPHHRRRVAWSAVELAQEGGNLLGGEEEPALQLERAEELEEWRALLRRVAEDLSPADRRVLDLMLAGERKTEVYAAALGIAGRPDEEQTREVKRAKDRIMNRLKRGGAKHG
jgi:RNA polymerase sigma-70 factor (ECF subfamily)